MAGEQKIIAIKPEQALAGLMGIVVLVLFFQLIFALEDSHRKVSRGGGEMTWYHRHYDKLSINTHFPGVTGNHRSPSLGGRISRFAGYVPAALPLVFVVALATYSLAAAVFAKPESSLLEDPEFNVRHLGVDTPELCHLPPLLHVCPERNRRAIVEAIAMGEMEPYAPASSASEIDDSPGTYAEKRGGK
jgi:hypothetical protein